MIVTSFWEAMQAGKELANAKTWKNRQLLANKLTIFLGAAVAIATFLGYPIPLSPEQIGLLVNALLLVVGLFNWAATLVSTTRVGLPPRDDVLPDRGDDGSGNTGDARSASLERDDSGPDNPVPYLNDMEHRG